MGVPVDRVAVVPCGVDLGLFRPDGPIMRHADQNGYVRILSIGRLVPRKGVDTIIEALRQVPGAQLIVAGASPVTRRRCGWAGWPPRPGSTNGCASSAASTARTCPR